MTSEPGRSHVAEAAANGSLDSGARQDPPSGSLLARVRRRCSRGGRVWAEAEVEKGATFYFTLPGAAGSRLGRIAVTPSCPPSPSFLSLFAFRIQSVTQ